MLNSQKFTTAEERASAFEKFCLEHICNKCQLEVACSHARGQFAWLDLEAEEEKPLPCPYCGGKTWVRDYVPANERVYDILCHGCEYRSQKFYSRDHVVAAHNQIARAVRFVGMDFGKDCGQIVEVTFENGKVVNIKENKNETD